MAATFHLGRLKTRIALSIQRYAIVTRRDTGWRATFQLCRPKTRKALSRKRYGAANPASRISSRNFTIPQNLSYPAIRLVLPAFPAVFHEKFPGVTLSSHIQRSFPFVYTGTYPGVDISSFDYKIFHDIPVLHTSRGM